MSTNKTTNYQLHSWLPSDEFHVSEINENFTKLDAALKAEAQERGRVDSEAARLVCGSYTGPSSTTTIQINLGFKPKVVFAMNSTGAIYSAGTTETRIALAVDSTDDCGIVINATGFLARNLNKSYMAEKAIKYNYLALR